MDLFVNTKLDAVNECLAAIGDSPVSSLDEYNADADSAERAISVLSRTIQTNGGKGWWFNTEWCISYTPNPTTGYVQLPNNLLADDIALDPQRYVSDDTYRLAVRGFKLYDTYNSTYDMRHISALSDDGKVYLKNIIIQLEFDALPQVVKDAVTAAARMKFAQDFEADYKRVELLREPARLAYFLIQKDELKHRKHNYIKDNETIENFIVKAGGRNNPR